MSLEKEDRMTARMRRLRSWTTLEQEAKWKQETGLKLSKRSTYIGTSCGSKLKFWNSSYDAFYWLYDWQQVGAYRLANSA